jgi:hypothetical protein
MHDRHHWTREPRSLSRRRLLLGSVGVAIAAVGLDQFALAQAAKVGKEAAKYQNEPKDGKACAQCRFFKAPSACERVEGEISPNGWCSFWAAKS